MNVMFDNQKHFTQPISSRALALNYSVGGHLSVSSNPE